MTGPTVLTTGPTVLTAKSDYPDDESDRRDVAARLGFESGARERRGPRESLTDSY